MIYFSIFLTSLIFYLFRDKKFSLLDPYSIFFISYLYYVYYPPLLLLLWENEYLKIHGYIFNIEDDFHLIYFALTVSNFFFFSFGYYILKKYSPFNIHNFILNNDKVYLKLIFFLIILFILFNYNNFKISIISYENNYIYTYKNSFYAYSKYFIVSSMAIIFIYMIIYNKNYHIYYLLSNFFYLSISFALFDKDFMVYSLPTTMSYLGRIYGYNKYIIIYIIISFFMLSLFTIIPSFSLYRATGDISLCLFSCINIDLALSDAKGPFLVSMIVWEGVYETDNYPPLIESWILWIPRFIYNERPLDMAEIFARNFIINWKEGEGMAFSLFAEGYLRYGIEFMFIIYLISGATFSFLTSFFSAFVPDKLRYPLVIAGAGYIAFLINRSPYSAIITLSMQFWVPYMLVSLFLRFYSKQKGLS